MTDLEMCQQALDRGDATAFLGVADSYAETGHPMAEELAELANTIVYEPDWTVALMAGTVFLAILEDMKEDASK